MADARDLLAAARRAIPADAERLTHTFGAAFAQDPTWKWAIGGSAPENLQAAAKFWRLLIDGALAHNWVWLLPGAAAITLWLPPGAAELPPEAEETFDDFLLETFVHTADRVNEIFNRFETARPHDVAHFYLSVLATDPAHRGHGLGMGLLAQNLQLLDEMGLPTYLESTNPANLHRYGALGFEVRDELHLAGGGPTVTTMWRPVGEGTQQQSRI